MKKYQIKADIDLSILETKYGFKKVYLAYQKMHKCENSNVELGVIVYHTNCSYGNAREIYFYATNDGYDMSYIDELYPCDILFEMFVDGIIERVKEGENN